MLSYRENDICAYWLHCLKEQLAIRAGKLRIIPGAIGSDFRGIGKSTRAALL
jgi:hypothetical protein